MRRHLHRPILESLLFSIALAVGLTPELLPMIVTVTLSRGAVRMAQKQVIVKQLEAIHNLGSMDVLCTDKTGTLTEATIQLAKHIVSRGLDSAQVLRLAYLNSYFETGLKSALDDAILAQPLSSIFDFLTFYLMRVPFRAGETAFHTGWFIESIATQVLVVFVIRTRGNPFKSRCSAWLTASSLSAVLLAVIVPFTPIAGMLGFVPLSTAFITVLSLIVLAYLALVQTVKQILNRRELAYA